MHLNPELDLEAAHAILRKVGDVADGKSPEPKLLLEDLNWDLLRYRGYVQLDDRSRFQAHALAKQMDAALRRVNLNIAEGINPHFLKMLESAAKATNSQPGAASYGLLGNAYATLESDENEGDLLASSLEDSLCCNSEIKYAIGAEEAVIAALASLANLKAWLRQAVDVPPMRMRFSPISQLVGTMLPETFAKHFGREFAIRRSGAYPAGPDIRFCLAVLNAAKITSTKGAPYSARSVEKYWKIMRRNQMRRNPRGTSSSVITNSV
ncbi:hypothetical protein AB8A20_19905 [Tardiphaga sp. 604_B6_N1_1]|uniref:hypothetical protein n=1 Tax=Tardiphaga sp. 604_B6_N1_1 TaxID=3240779 RepID=UPI003F201F0C